MMQTYIAQIPKLATSIKSWLFTDLKQSIALADQHDLFDDIDFKNLHANHPKASLFYGSYFKTLTKLCLIPGLVILADLLLVLFWGMIVRLCSAKSPLFFGSVLFEEMSDFIVLWLFVGFIVVIYFGLMYIILNRYVWRFTLLKHIFCPQLKYGSNIVKIIKHLTVFGIKIFLSISAFSSLIGAILYHRPITIYCCLPAIIMSFTITNWLFNAELQRVGIKPLFVKFSGLLKNIG